ncbi:MAG: N-acetylneuraminate synthase [Aquabacterium sp.]
MSRVFIIAEAGVNHNGSETLALQLVDVAAEAGADAVKFQTFSADKLVARGTAKAEYQQRETGGGDQHSMLRALELSEAAHRRIAAHCRSRGIEFMSTPFDDDAARLLVGLGMRRIKVPSGEITNSPFLRVLASFGLPLVLSTGMADLAEILDAVDTVKAAWSRMGRSPAADDLTILHCTSNYPADVGDVNLNAMATIAAATGMPVGYSDHTLGIAVSTAAVALGARVIEKHFTLDTLLAGPDHRASLDPAGLKALVQAIRDIERAMGSAVKAPTATELPVRALVRRSIAAARDLPAGTALALADLQLLRPGSGLPPSQLDVTVGRRTCRAIAAGTLLSPDDLQ